MVPIKQRLDNDDHYVGGNTKQYIIEHDTGNATDSDEGNANYFCTGSRGASAHYFVDDDSITQVVLDDDCSWHCGDGGGAYGITNRNSIGIEMCRVNGVITEKTKQNAIDLTIMLMKKYNIPLDKVCRHYDASRKNCPASMNLDGKWSGWYEFKNQLQAKLQTPIIKEEVKVKNLVVYGNSVDKRASEYLADALKCATLDGNIDYDYSTVENVYCVGGQPSMPWTSYAKEKITGASRYDTMQLVLNKIKSLGL